MSALKKTSRRVLAALVLLGVAGATVAMRTAPDGLDRVMARGELIVASRVSPSTWYSNQHGETGIEYELARAFADRLGVGLRMVPATSVRELYRLLRDGEVDLIAAGLSADRRWPDVRFTAPYQNAEDILVHREGERTIDSLEQLAGKRIVVLADSGQERQLRNLRLQGFDIAFHRIEGHDVGQVLDHVLAGDADLALIDSNAWTVQRPLYPELRRGLSLGEHPLAWALRQRDDRLHQAADDFLRGLAADGTLARLEERFFGHVSSFNLYSARSFLRHLDERLPLYLDTFRGSADQHGFDWRLLAALGYQESLWDPAAVSPTGVRGLMMLTHRTAREMGVADRTDPFESIRAGAAYLRKLHDRLPQRIPEPDRTWMAVAAYNVGIGHLEDARILTQRQGGNPDSWADVRERLPLLRDKRYYPDTRYGYARGAMQAVIYVQHIRRYYDLLIWATGNERHGATLLAAND